jgi:hypothetical protein
MPAPSVLCFEKSALAVRRLPSGLPVFDPQGLDATELADIVGDDDQAMSKRSRCNHHVVRADERSGAAQVRKQFRMNVGNLGIERQARKECAKLLGALTILRGFGREQRTGDQLAADNGRKRNVVACLHGVSGEQRGLPPAQDFDAGVGIEQKPHGCLPACGFRWRRIGQTIGKVGDRAKETQHIHIGAADATAVGGLHAQEQQKVQGFPLHILGKIIDLTADKIGNGHGVFLINYQALCGTAYNFMMLIV